MKYKAIKAYSDAPQQPIVVQRGEVLEFIEASDPNGDWPNWVYCQGIDKQGWVPKQILKLDDSLVTCMQDYSAKEHNLEVGDILLGKDSLNGWAYAAKQDNCDMFAWAPLNCLEEL
ncbi:hypothetical protein DBZ36_12465 [Alginatibacterium sediminis]|uniref:SH3 domain-containing protein n=1 Tax=Alginatibacterium sediminis TaxID=2164068 RepID=A0A420EBI0_9ALTE|nr:SH3 domain-containing protein [Alginatibacterium sediminis]RKF18050.1 hypothetical protein DBZ36_12465 [Alginatibacterium sediminis]